MSDSSLGLMHRATSARKSFGNPWFRVSEPFKMDGLIMDAEGGPDFFRGGVNEAHTYGNAMREVANNPKKLLGIFSNDIPQNLPGWLPKFNEIATKADFNFPQTYYGASASVASRVDKAENANAHLTIPFIPVGAGFIGTEYGGCASAQACAERATIFIQLCKDRGYQGYSLWHWGGAPMPLWEVLNKTTAVRTTNNIKSARTARRRHRTLRP